MAEYGWVGKILIVDLSLGNISTVPTSDYVPQWIGGRALAAKLYWDEVPPDCAAFDPENRLIFATGPIVGTPGAGSGRTAVATKAADAITSSATRLLPSTAATSRPGERPRLRVA